MMEPLLRMHIHTTATRQDTHTLPSPDALLLLSARAVLLLGPDGATVCAPVVPVVVASEAAAAPGEAATAVAGPSAATSACLGEAAAQGEMAPEAETVTALDEAYLQRVPPYHRTATGARREQREDLSTPKP
jgi:hypothetical protein